MFAQFIEGRVADAAELERQYERWLDDIAPGARGWLGSTAGVTEDGTGFVTARFTDADAARANSDRPEQSDWWKAAEACFEGPVEFLDCDDVQLFLGGGSDDAGFVQVIRGRAKDVDRARAALEEMESDVSERRPDVIGGFIGTQPDGEFAQVVYFTSEEEAREGEVSDPDEADPFWDLVAEEPRFLDLKEPWLHSA